MEVLILGARGMLGRALVHAFETENVVAWDREELDITDAAAVEKHLSFVVPDVVINAAAYTDVEKAEEEEELAERVNGDAVGFLAESCAKHNLPLLHISTDYVFNGRKEGGYEESDVPEHPLNAYGRSKLLGERLLQEKASKFWLVRTAWLFGPHGKHFVDKMLQLGKEKKELRVVADQYGSPTYTHDLARALWELIHDQAPFGIYHLTNSGVTTWAEFAKEIFMIVGWSVNIVPVTSEEFSTKAKRPKKSVLKNTKRPPLRHFREALKGYLNIRNAKHL